MGNAKDWMRECSKREQAAIRNKDVPGSERRVARSLLIRAEETVKLMEQHGAVDRGFLESMINTQNFVTGGQWQLPGWEVNRFLFLSISVSLREDCRRTCLSDN